MSATTQPTLRLLSLGVGVQSTTLFLLAAQGTIEPFDYVLFADAADFDAAIRYGHPAAAKRGMPLRGTYYLHSSRRPLAEVDLGIDNGPEPEGCSPCFYRGDTAQEPAQGGDAE